MNSGRDDGRILAHLERRLARDDPDLAAIMDALNRQFTDEPRQQAADGPETDPETGPGDAEKRRNRRMTAVTVLAITAILGLFLTALLNGSPQRADPDPGTPRGPGTGVPTQSEPRFAPRTPPRGRRPGTAAAGCPAVRLRPDPARARGRRP
ncbi:DUF3040 domain-containing protein [Streptomyces sp. PKU-MA01144]|uniref:DUF3040 domain-containing protein n=1 Tax=Streptomyces sp. PKU-MA01144 TaxID=2729138 RepID=UPI0004831BCC|nr:DUF3040 domain-containing protein [Streptomyces sp. PKU-MA01144]NNJ05330.1 DUF3040 domain-containing protein [Streptomyces sp. PKU-MA01144]